MRPGLRFQAEAKDSGTLLGAAVDPAELVRFDDEQARNQRDGRGGGVDRVGRLRPPTSFPNTTPFPVNVQSWSAGRPVPFHCLSLDLHCILLEIPPSFVCISPPFVGPSLTSAFCWSLTAFRCPFLRPGTASRRSTSGHSWPSRCCSPPAARKRSPARPKRCSTLSHLSRWAGTPYVGTAARPLHETDCQPCPVISSVAHCAL